MVDVVLLEVEDVLFDTRELRDASVRDAMTAFGLERIPETDDVLADLLALRAARSFASRLATGGLVLRAGALAFVDHAAAAARLAVVTRANRSELDAMLTLAGIADRFAVAVSADDVLSGKPSPDGYNLALDRLGRQRRLAPGGSLALEAGTAGIRAARSARIRSVAIGPLPAHVAIDADAYVDTLDGHTLASLDRLARSGTEHVQ